MPVAERVRDQPGDGMTSGALLSLIAHAHFISIRELLVSAQVGPKKLLCLLKELHAAKFIEVEGVRDLAELDGLFARHQTMEFDESDVPFVADRQNLITALSAEQQPDPVVRISRRGLSRALTL